MNKKLRIYGMSMCALLCFASCSSDEKDQPSPSPDQKGVEFIPNLSEPVRATDTRFESGDAISVWAVKAVNGSAGTLKSSGNYADNVRFDYNGSRFVAHSSKIEKSDADLLNYFAVYPYASSNSNRFSFRVMTDQTSRTNYTLSDLCAAITGVLESSTVELSFFHVLSQIVIDVDSSFGNVTGIDLNGMCISAVVDLNEQMIYGSSTYKGTIKMSSNGTRSYRAIIPIQKVSKDYKIATVHTDSGDYDWNIEEAVEFKTGRSYYYQLKVKDSGVINFGGSITPWETN